MPTWMMPSSTPLRRRRCLAGLGWLGPALLLLATLHAACAQAPAGSPEGETVRIDTGHGVFRVPYAYLNIRPPPGALQPTNYWKQFGFAFWMPDGRPVAQEAMSLPTLRPQEAGQPQPGPDEYVVIAVNVTSLADPDAQPPAEVQFKNFLSGMGSEMFDYQERFGLIEATPKPGRQEVTNNYFGAKLFTNPLTEARVNFRCWRNPGPWIVNHICDGIVTFSSPEVSFHLRIPEDRMDDLLEVVRRIASLLVVWQETPSQR